MGSYFSTQNIKKYGWKRDRYDHRDYVHTFFAKNIIATQYRKNGWLEI